MRNAEGSSMGMLDPAPEPGVEGVDRECGGAEGEAVVSPCRMVLRAAALALHLCLLSALRPSDPNVCSYWER